MLNLKKVLGAKPKEHVEAQLEEMLTPWGEALDANRVLQEHPTPQLRRDSYQVLNGTWACAFVENGHEPEADLASICASASQPAADAFSTSIVVPFSPEAPLSGARRQLQPSELLWYRRSFQTPALDGGERCLLHFQAVDYACACYVNDQLVGTHEGGYTPFTFDITDCLKARTAVSKAGESAPLKQDAASESGDATPKQDAASDANDAPLGANEVSTDANEADPTAEMPTPAADDNVLMLCVADPSEFGGHVRGKQRFDRGDIWYTAQSGIWQTVWMETVPAAHVLHLQVEPDLNAGVLVLGVETSASPQGAEPSTVRVEVLDANDQLVSSGEDDVENGVGAVAVSVPSPHAWSPTDPYLYQLKVLYGDDVVHSYCGFRTVEMRQDDTGHARVFLNGKPLFIKGVLDQAYWSDGLMTAPSDEALVFDIQAMRDAGFNLMRKHIKVESARWYYHCDRMGMLVLQDMVQGGDGEIHTWDWSYKPTLFKFSWNHYRDDKPGHWEKLGAASAAYRDEWTKTCKETVRLLRNSPSIIGWSLFNEGWGQFNSNAALDLVRSLDPTRVIDAVSGWYDQGRGDFYSVHNYFRDLNVWRCRYGRASFVSEFGGFSHRVEGHSSLPECYGYEVYDNRDEWRRAVRELLAHMDSLEDKGLAGYVYTQVSDIEEETNGLLTYDRRVDKMA